jgi:hypothetical protein
MLKNIVTKLLVLLILILNILNAKAQKLAGYGKVTKEEVLATSCSYEKDAPAEVLIDDGFTWFEWNNDNFFRMVIEKRIRIKIYNNSALNYADVKLQFLTNEKYERINNVAAASYNLENGEVVSTKLEKKLIYSNKLNENFSEISFAIPNVKAGTVIEYKYTIHKDSYSNIDPWYFQRDIPVAQSNFKLQVPEFIRFTTKGYTPAELQKTVTDDSKSISTGGRILTFQNNIVNYYLSKVKSLRKEPFMNSYRDYIMRMEFQLSEIVIGTESYKYTTNWEQIAKELKEHDYFGAQIKKKASIPDLDIMMLLQKTKEDKIKTLHNYFRSKFYYTGIRDYYCKNIKEIASTKTGTSGDINLLFLSKLKEYDIESYPILLSTKDHGTVNTLYPFLKQFNTVMAYIPMQDSSFWIIDAANKYNVATDFPPNVVLTNGLKIEKEISNWVDLIPKTIGETNNTNISIQIDSVGQIIGSGYVTNFGYSKIDALKKGTKDKPNFIGDKWNNIIYEKIKTTNADNDSASLETTFELKATTVINGNYYLLPINIFNQWQQNPFTEKQRFSDIDFNHTRKYNCTIHVTLPEAFTTDVLPKNIKLSNEDGTIKLVRRVVKEDNILLVNISLTMENALFMASEYETVQEYFTQMFNYLDEPILLVKK